MTEILTETEGKLEELGGVPPRLKDLFHNIYKVNGDNIHKNKISIEDALAYFEHYPLQFYNLMYYARWFGGIFCPECGCESIMQDITLTTVEYPFYRCSPGFDQPNHRFNGFQDTVFESSTYSTTPILSWVKGIVFYLNSGEGKEPTLKEMVEVIGTQNKNIFWRSDTARNIVKLLKFSRKSRVFGKHFRVETMGHLVRVLKWVMSFNGKGELDPLRATNCSFSDRKLTQSTQTKKK